ncbi:hypothetical protein BZG35_04080 [Brevundimonas sp. LM2]|nr:hypothetical protein BZG35_04080 [Brevundimonas sp. LM2]
MQTTTIAFGDDLSVYLSPTAIEPNAVVGVGARVEVALGQTARLNDTRLLTAFASGLPGVAALINDGEEAWTWGLCRTLAGEMAPICAFPLHGHGMGMLAPTDRIVAVFATDSTPLGSVVETAFGPGLLIDFSGAKARAVSFDIDRGWAAEGAAWARRIPAGSALGPLLIAR